MPSPPPTLEQELLRLAEAVAPERDARIVARVWGWDGRGGATLEAAGLEAGGLSRERVRQLCRRAEARLRDSTAAGAAGRATALPTAPQPAPSAGPPEASSAGRAPAPSAGPPTAPRLDEALLVAAEAAPTTRGALSRLLADRGIAAHSFHPVGLRTAARLLGREPAFTLEVVKGVEVVLPYPDDPGLETRQLVVTIVDTARGVVRRGGAARVADVTGRVAGELGSWVDADLARAVVSELDDFLWLDRRTGWFFLAGVARNAVVSRVLKVLSVAGELDVGQLHEGVRRDERMREFVMPEYVLAELCQRMPRVTVEGRLVRAVEEIGLEDVLEATELAFVRVLRRHEGPVERRELERLCRREGVTASSFNNRVSYSPIVEDVGHGRYALRGTTTPLPAPSTEADVVPHPGELDHFRTPRRR